MSKDKRNIPAKPQTSSKTGIVKPSGINAAQLLESLRESKIGKFFSNFFLMQILVAVLGMAVYINSVSNIWAVDDLMVITSNKFTKRGVTGISGLLKYDTFYGFFDDDKAVVAGGRWRPLTPVMFAVEAELFAPAKKDAKGDLIKDKEGYSIKDFDEKNILVHIYHLINVLLYGLLCLILYKLFLMLLNPLKNKDNFKANFVAAVATALFAVHPLHTEAVANIKGRDEIMALMGCLLATYWILKGWYASQAEQESATLDADVSDAPKFKKPIVYIVAACAAYMMSLLSKESGVTFLAVIPLAFWFFTNADLKSIAVRTAPLLLVFLAFFGMRSMAIGGQKLTGFETDELMNDPFLMVSENTVFKPLLADTISAQNNTLLNGNIPSSAKVVILDSLKTVVKPTTETYIKMPYTNQLATIVQTAGVYLKLLFVPHPLTNDYYPRHIEMMSFGDLSVILSLLINVFLAFWAIKQIPKRNPIAFGILYYFATFSIISNVLFPIGTNMSERFMFMPSVGFALSIALLLYGWGEKAASKNGASGFNMPIAAVAAICGVFALITVMRNPSWYNDFTLFKTDIEVSKNSAKLNNAVGGSSIDMANIEEAKELQEIAKLPGAQQKAATDAARKRRDEKIQGALKYLRTALTIHPGYSGAWLLYGNANYYMAQTGDPKTALLQFRTAIAAYEQAKAFRPDHEDVKQNTGVVYRDMGKFCGEKLGQLPLAVQYLEKSLDFNKDDSETFRLLGTAYGVANQHERAIENFEKSLKIRPGDMGTMENLSVAYQLIGRSTGNKEMLQKAEAMLLDVYKAGLTIPEDNPERAKTITRTLNLLQQNYGIMGNAAKQSEYRTEILKIDPNFKFI